MTTAIVAFMVMVLAGVMPLTPGEPHPRPLSTVERGESAALTPSPTPSGRGELAGGLCPAVTGAVVVFDSLSETRTDLKCKYAPNGESRDVTCVRRFNAGSDGIWELRVSRVNADGLQVCKYEQLESHYLPDPAVVPAAFRGAR